MVQEIAVDRDVGAFDGKRLRFQPCRVGVLRRLAGGALAQEHDVGDDAGALPLEGVGGQADRAQEIRLLRQVLADGRVLLVQREMAGDQGEDAAGL